MFLNSSIYKQIRIWKVNNGHAKSYITQNSQEWLDPAGPTAVS